MSKPMEYMDQKVMLHCKNCFDDLGAYTMNELYQEGIFSKESGVDMKRLYCSDKCRLIDRFKGNV